MRPSRVSYPGCWQVIELVLSLHSLYSICKLKADLQYSICLSAILKSFRRKQSPGKQNQNPYMILQAKEVQALKIYLAHKGVLQQKM